MTRNRAIIAGSIVALFGGSAAIARASMLPKHRALPGLRVEGFELPDDVATDDAKLTVYLGKRIDAALAREIEVVAGKAKRKVALRDVADAPDTWALARSIRAIGRDGTLARRLDLAMRARRGAIDVAIPITLRSEALESVAMGLKGDIDEPPADAKLDLASHGVVPDREGHSLELDGTVVTLQAELGKRLGSALRWDPAAASTIALDPVDLTITATPAKVLASTLKAIDINTVVGTFETHFGRGGDQAPRATNIEVASKKLDGLVLKPGELMSFNAVVGERSEANGFKMAWEIFKGEMRPGFGGGTCQVASTFHAAAFMGALDVLERLPHSRPSAYITMGLDSTVVYPVVDLKVKNPHDFPVVVHTIIGANKLTVEILGKAKPATVVFGRDVVDTFPYVRKIEEEPWVKPGQAIKKQGGIRGYRVRRTRTIKYASGAPNKVETTYDFYPPTTEIYLVAPGTDPNDLPALPEDVKEMLAKKNGEPIPSPVATDAVACAGDCAKEPKPAIEIKNAAGVHDPTGDQAGAPKSVSIAH
jgi:vancomycin resistance protein YoaR